MTKDEAIIKAIVDAEEWTGGPLAYDTARFKSALAVHGYAVLPLEADEKMRHAGANEIGRHDRRYDSDETCADAVWRAMAAAAE